MPLSEIPPIFGRIPTGLFGPLSSPLAPLYWAILARVYQYEFEREPFFLIRPVAVEVTEELLRESPLWAERREELLALEADAEEAGPPGPTEDEGLLLRAAARRLVARLEAAGWFHFEYRSSIGHVLSFYPYAARILETLVRVARDEQPVFQGYAHSIASLLKPETFAARPGVSLREAKRHTLELTRELKILDRNIYAFTQRLLDEVSTAAGVLEEGIDHYRHAVLANYHRLKTIDNLYKWRGEILYRLDAIERDELSLEAAVRWYAEQFGVDLDTAARHVAEDLRVMRMQFETMPQITDDIDVRNARFSGVALRKLMYLLRQDRHTEGQLQFLVDRLARDQAPELPFDVYRCELLADGFLYTLPRQRPRMQPQPLARKPKGDADAVRQDVAARVRRPFARARVDAYVERLLAGRTRVPLGDVPVDGDEDYVRLIYMAAYGLDGGSAYTFRLEEEADAGRERKGRYGFPRGSLERRRTKR
jgi:hypothetical protein